MESIPQVYLLHCFREANRCADTLAKFGTSMEDAFAIFESPPFIAKPLHSDKLDLTQDHVCNMVVITTQFVLIYYPIYEKKILFWKSFDTIFIKNIKIYIKITNYFSFTFN